MVVVMQSELLGALCARQSDIRARWTELLHVEPVNTPLAHPEALTHLIDWTLAEIFRALTTGGPRERFTHPHVSTPNRSLCVCGKNPLLTYFEAAAQALREALVLVQVTRPFLDPIERDASLEELNLVLARVARHEIEAFCGICQHRSNSSESATCPNIDAHTVV
jgi:hypothetical protein